MDVAHGEINIGLNDKATPELRRIEAEYRASMARIDSMEAEAEIKADISDLEGKIKAARDQVKMLEGEKAEVTLKADKKRLSAAIKEAQAEVRRLDGQKATIEIETRGQREALANIARVTAAEAARAAANQRYSAQAEKAAYRENEIRTKSALNAAKEVEQVARLQKEYARLTDRIEALDKRRTPFGREAKMKLEVDRAGALASFERVKQELRLLGGHPPVHIKVDTDRSDMSRVRRALLSVRDSAAGIGAKGLDALGNVGNIRIFGNSLRTVAAVGAALAPVLVSVAGAATALVGVLGTGLAGAGAVAGGVLSGLLLNLGGLKSALHPVAADFKINTQLVDAYHKAVLKFGKGSDQAIKAQDQMNHALRTMDPSARAAAKAAGALRTEWTKLTQKDTASAFNSTVLQGSKTLSALMPTLARNTNTSSRLISTSLNSLFTRLRTPAGIHIFDSLGKSSNAFLKPALAGINSLVMAFLHVSEAAGRLFAGKAGNGFAKWASDIEKATQPGAKLDAQVQRLGNHATDLIHFFGALGRLLVTVFNGGADSGDRMLNSMTKALNRWNDALKSGPGQKSLTDFFSRAEAGARALWGAIGPLIGAFVQWSSLLAPFTSGLLKGIGFVANLVAGFTKLVGLGGPLAALGATIGAAFAVSKLGAFVGMLARVVGLLREARAVAATSGAFAAGAHLRQNAGSIFSRGGAGAAGMAEGGAAAGAEIRTAMAAGGAAAAAEIRTAMTVGGARGGALGTAEGAASRGGVILPAGAGAAAARETEQVGAAAARSAGRLRGAATAAGSFAAGLIGIPAPALAVVAAGAAIIGGMVAVDHALNSGSRAAWTHIKNLDQAVSAGQGGVARANTRYLEARDALGQFGSSLAHSNVNVREARKALAQTTKGTQEYRDRLLDVHDAERQRIEDRKAYFEDQGNMDRAANQQKKNADVAVAANRREIAGLKERAKQGGIAGKIAQFELDKAEARQAQLEETQTASWNKVAALPMQAARGIKGFAALTGEAEQAVGRLARTAGGKSIATKISVKYDDPAKAGRVASQAKDALQAGVGRGAVMKIVADSSNADQAIRRLRAARIEAKRIAIRAATGDALAAMAALKGIKLTPKILRLLHQGDPSVIAAVRRIVGMGIPGKVMKVAGNIVDALRKHGNVSGLPDIFKALVINARDHATSVWDNLKNSIDNVVKTVTIITKRHGKAEGGPVLPAEKRIPFGADDPAFRRASASGAQSTHGGLYSRPTLLVGEESRSEYVIATNPAYREDNKEYLKMAASDLGMLVVDAAKKGKKKAASPNTPGVAGTRSQAAALGVPDPYSVGAVPLDDVQTAVDTFDSAVKKQKDLVSSLTTTVRGIRTKGLKGKAKSNALARIKDYKKHIHAAQYGGNWRNLHYRPLKDLDVEDRNAKTDLGHLKHFNAQIAQLNQRIANDRTRMGTDATLYGRTGQKKYLDDYNTWKKDRLGALSALVGDDGQGGILGTAQQKAQSLAAKFPTDAMKAWVGQLGGDIADAMGDQADANAPDPTYDVSTTPPTLDDFIASLGRTDELANLQRDYALAQVNDVPDNLGTSDVNENTASLSDNLSTAQNIRDFYSSVLSKAQSAGQPASVITDAANSFVSARDTWQGISDTITSSQQAAAAQAAQDQTTYTSARADLFSSMGSNFAPIWAQPGAAPVGFGGSGFGGAGEQNAVQPNTTQVSVVNNFPTPPPDPHTWSNGLSWELQAAL